MYQGWGSNPRPHAYEACATTTELPWHNYVAGPGVAPGLGDYEPPVRLYTTPRQ